MLSSQRITALDMARFIAMFMMVQGHVIDALVNPIYTPFNEFPWNLWQFARGFTAQVFLMLSGTVHVFANKRMEDGRLAPINFKRRITTALMIMGIGYLFMFPANKIWDIFFIEDRLWIHFCRVNILQLIGFTLILVMGMFYLTRSDKGIGRLALGTGIAISLLSPIVHSINAFDYLPEMIGAYFSFEHGSFFPIFPYSAFMFFGLYIGVKLKAVEPDKRTKYLIRWFLPMGLLMIGVGFLLRMELKDLGWGIPIKVNPGAIMYQVGFVLTGIAVCAFLYTKTKKLTFYYAMFGKRALMIYVLHLILLYGSPWWASVGNIYNKQMSLEWTLFFVVIIEFCTFGIVYLYEYLINKYEKFRKYYLYVLAIVGGYLILVGNIWMW
jgi:uncharacterized membrane protein